MESASRPAADASLLAGTAVDQQTISSLEESQKLTGEEKKAEAQRAQNSEIQIEDERRGENDNEDLAADGLTDSPESSPGPKSKPAQGAKNKIKQVANAESPVLKSHEIFGAVKVKDGLFLGDQYSAQDLEFLAVNKISHIVNCAGRQLQNQWTSVGVKYLTFYWLDDDRQLLFDENDQVAYEVQNFIDEAADEYYGILVHSIRGQSRACCVICIYLMEKFNWSLMKALEFINSRRPNLEIRGSFLQQLQQWQMRRRAQGFPTVTELWDPIPLPKQSQSGLNEEVILRNTFVNAQMVLLSEPSLGVESQTQSNTDLNQRIQWSNTNLIQEHADQNLSANTKAQHRKSFTGKGILKKAVKQTESKPEIDSIISLQPASELLRNDVVGSKSESAQEKRMELSMKDDKKPAESINSGENHVNEALAQISTFDSREPGSSLVPPSNKVQVKEASASLPAEPMKDRKIYSNSAQTEKKEVQKVVIKTAGEQPGPQPQPRVSKTAPNSEETKRLGSAKLNKRKEIQRDLLRKTAETQQQELKQVQKQRPSSKRIAKQAAREFEKIKIKGNKVENNISNVAISGVETPQTRVENTVPHQAPVKPKANNASGSKNSQQAAKRLNQPIQIPRTELLESTEEQRENSLYDPDTLINDFKKSVDAASTTEKTGSVRSKFIDNLAKKQDQKAAKKSEQISYIGQINNNNNNINNFFIQDATGLFQKQEQDKTGGDHHPTAIQPSTMSAQLKSAKRVQSQPHSPKNSLAKENLMSIGEKAQAHSNYAEMVREQVKKIKNSVKRNGSADDERRGQPVKIAIPIQTQKMFAGRSTAQSNNNTASVGIQVQSGGASIIQQGNPKGSSTNELLRKITNQLKKKSTVPVSSNLESELNMQKTANDTKFSKIGQKSHTTSGLGRRSNSVTSMLPHQKLTGGILPGTSSKGLFYPKPSADNRMFSDVKMANPKNSGTSANMWMVKKRSLGDLHQPPQPMIGGNQMAANNGQSARTVQAARQFTQQTGSTSLTQMNFKAAKKITKAQDNAHPTQITSRRPSSHLSNRQSTGAHLALNNSKPGSARDANKKKDSQQNVFSNKRRSTRKSADQTSISGLIQQQHSLANANGQVPIIKSTSRKKSTSPLTAQRQSQPTLQPSASSNQMVAPNRQSQLFQQIADYRHANQQSQIFSPPTEQIKKKQYQAVFQGAQQITALRQGDLQKVMAKLSQQKQQKPIGAQSQPASQSQTPTLYRK